MLEYKKVLVPYDGSDHAKKALKQAVDLVRAGDHAELLVATICQMAAVAGEFDWASIMGKELLKNLETECRNTLAEAEKLVPPDVNKKMLFKIGSPAPVLQEMAEENDCDLIVMGSRGLGSLKGMLMGSVSSYLVSRAHCPVLIVK